MKTHKMVRKRALKPSYPSKVMGFKRRKSDVGDSTYRLKVYSKP